MTIKDEIRSLLPQNMEGGEAAAKKIAAWHLKKGEEIRKITSIFKMKPGTGGDFYYLTSDEFEKVGQAIREFCEEK